MGPVIPILSGCERQVPAQALMVPAFEIGGATLAEHREELVVFEIPDRRQLEFQQGVLAKIHVHGMDPPRRIECVIEGVAAGRSDEDQFIVGPQAQDLAVQPGILPAGVVDEVVSMDVIEEGFGRPVGQRSHAIDQFVR